MESSSNAKQHVQHLIGDLSDIQQKLQVNPFHPLLPEEEDLLTQLHELQTTEKKNIRQNPRLNWFKAGDGNTKFFHASIKARKIISIA